MTKPRTHEDHRRKVCAICYCQNGSSVKRHVCPTEERIIKKLISGDYSVDNPKFPTGLCGTCRIDIYKLEKKLIKSIFVSQHFGVNIPIQLRSQGGCQCVICEIGRLSGPAYKTQLRKWKDDKENRVLFYPTLATVDEDVPPDHDVNNEQLLQPTDHLQFEDVPAAQAEVPERDPCAGADGDAAHILDPCEFGPRLIFQELDLQDESDASDAASESPPPMPGPGSEMDTSGEMESIQFCSSCHNEMDIHDEVFGTPNVSNMPQEESVILDASGDSQRTEDGGLESVEEETSQSPSSEQPSDPALQVSVKRDLCSKCFSEVRMIRQRLTAKINKK